MKVDHNLPQHLQQLASGQGRIAERPAGDQKTENNAPTGDDVKVSLSPVTQTMTNGVARSGTDSFDVSKVQAMRTAIENGSFSPNAEAIAERMLSGAREMLGIAASN